MITRRQVVIGGGALAAAAIGLPAYALGVEPFLRLELTTYDLTPRGWPAEQDLTIAVLADIHAIDPWMTPARIASIAAYTNSLGADLILLAGDYVRSIRPPIGRTVPTMETAAALAALRAPLGVHAILGNHDVMHDAGRDVLAAFGAYDLPVLQNKAIRLEKDGRGFWLLGLADQIGPYVPSVDDLVPQHDLPGTLAQVTTQEPVLLLAHEPDIFPEVPDRVSLTISGHTHGGQVRFPFLSPLIAPSTLSRRFSYGHYRLGESDLVVSGGLGMSGLPIRFNMPPEIVLIQLGKAKNLADGGIGPAQIIAKTA